MSHRSAQHWAGTAAGWLVLALIAPTALAQQLQPGRIATGSTSDEKVAELEFRAESAGILTVMARSTDESDLILVVTDGDGQPLPEGRSDQDIGGDTGAEQFAVTIPRAGTYRVRVETYSWETAGFRIGASWLAFPDLEVPPDPDGSPTTAIPIAVEQQSVSGSIDGSVGDYWDWYVLTADRSGTLTVATRAEDGDLVLEAFEEGQYSEALERSDQDLQGINGNEALTLLVTPGQTLYFKVSAFSEGTAIDYRLQIGFIPDK
jgi:hypothetical protein